MTRDINESQQHFSMKEKIKGIIKISRPQQYYKNVLVFVGVFFSGNLFYPELLVYLGIAFIVLCFVSSANYILNDIRDADKDRRHPEKKSRPIAAGVISAHFAFILAIALLILSMVLLWVIIPNYTTENIAPLIGPAPEDQPAVIHTDSKMAFFLVVCAIFITSQLYSFYLKDIPFADIVTIAMNYVWRAISGAVIISVFVSPWLIVLFFLVAILLALAKRIGDLVLLGEKEARKHKKVFESYTKSLLDQNVAVVSAITVLAIYIYLIETYPNETVFIVITIPLVFFVMSRYLLLISGNSVAVRKAEKLFFDKPLLVAGVILVLLFVIVIYYPGSLDGLIGLRDSP